MQGPNSQMCASLRDQGTSPLHTYTTRADAGVRRKGTAAEGRAKAMTLFRHILLIRFMLFISVRSFKHFMTLYHVLHLSSAKWAVHILHIGNDVCIFCISVILFCIFCILHAILSNIMKTCILLAYFAYYFAYFFAYSAY